MMTPRIVKSDTILIVGLKEVMSFMTNAQGTGDLARQFMPKRNQIINRIGNEKFSIQIYNQFDYNKMTLSAEYLKWVGVEVSSFEAIPDGLEALTIDASKYAVFNFEGKPEGFLEVWQAIHANWLPNSGYQLDDKPHFEKLPEDYHPSNTFVKEEIWVPIR